MFSRKISFRTDVINFHGYYANCISQKGDNISVLLIRDVEMVEAMRGQGIFSNLCEELIKSEEIDGIVYETVINKRLSDSFEKKIVKLPVKTASPIFKNLIEENPTFIQVRPDVQIVHLESLEIKVWV